MPGSAAASLSERPVPTAQTRICELEAANCRLSCLSAELRVALDARTSELGDARQQIIRLTETDQLTGLANRFCFAARLEQFVSENTGNDDHFALFLLNLDHFKRINDTLGHEVGDLILQHVAVRLFFAANAAITARLGGDEFALLIRAEFDPPRLSALAGDLLRAVSEPLQYNDRSLETGCSIGIARFPQDGVTAGELQRHADLALDAAKRIRSTFTVYEPAMGREYQKRQALSAELADAIGSGQIEPWFQPIYDHVAGHIVGIEALARWRHPTRGLLAPAQFLDLAEERGLMHALFARMLRASAPLIRRYFRPDRLRSVSINLSPSQFIVRNVADDIIALLEELDLPPALLIVEITEEVLMQEFGRASNQLAQLVDYGVRIALDDFGVGYSNINYLRQFPFHILKVDRSLIVDVTTEPKATSILGAIGVLARALDLKLVAEGVETTEQSVALADLGFRFQQGFLHGRPIPCLAFEQAATKALCSQALSSPCRCSHAAIPTEPTQEPP